jgi:Tfp pilus assembly protein PilF
LLLQIPIAAKAADNWVEVRSAHFTVSTNASEHEARRIADHFEQIREMFRTTFGSLRVNTAQPIVIVAAKNENTMKLYFPEEWETKGHVRPAGLYQAGQDKDYVLLRVDQEGENPYHTLYHEYTHALLRLNYDRLPLWLNEGFAEFFGNSTIYDKEIKTGTIDRTHLYILQQNRLIPIDTLLQVDYGSPYYNESDRASVFYAESWALVHYLMMDPEARKAGLMKKFLDSYGKSNDQVAAANETFGDLKKFAQRIEGYARQSSFMVGVIKMAQTSNEKQLPSRAMTPAEVLAERGDFFAHRDKLDMAKPLLEEALKEEPHLAFAHEAMGFYHYRTQKTVETDHEMQEAIRLGSTSFEPYYLRGLVLVRDGGAGDEDTRTARESLEKAVQMNPDFAPAYEALSHAYSHTTDGNNLAVNAAYKAFKLEPGELHYAVNLGYVLVNSDRTKEAHLIAQHVSKQAATPAEKIMAQSLEQIVAQREQWDTRAKASNGMTVVTADAASSGGNASSQGGEVVFQQRVVEVHQTDSEYEGEINSADCTKKPEIVIHGLVDTGPVAFHAADSEKVAWSAAKGVTVPAVTTCKAWKGRQARIWFRPTPGKEYVGEITKVQFF